MAHLWTNPELLEHLLTYPNPLRWTGDYCDRKALWPREPDILIITSLAAKHLYSELSDTLSDLDSIQVKFFAQGSFNKLYSISCHGRHGHNTRYIFRVSLPVVTYYKIESEAAVLSYIKKNTSIPVPRVIAWDSTARNPLGFGWMLLEMMDGISLYDVWRKITWESKLKIVAALAPLLGQLRDHRFSQIGSLYFTGREATDFPGLENSDDSCPGLEYSDDSYKSSVDYPILGANAVTVAEVVKEHGSPSKTSVSAFSSTAINDRDDSPVNERDDSPVNERDDSPVNDRDDSPVNDRDDSPVNDRDDSQTKSFARELEAASTKQASEIDHYTVGPLLDPISYLYRRVYLPGKRGPYRTSREWMTAKINFQKRWVETGPLIKTLTNGGDFDLYDWDSDCDRDAPEMAWLLDEHQNLLPSIFAGDEGSSPYVIHHTDLSLANILIDPDTYEITAIIDWEMTQIVPEWKSSRFPKFLTERMDFEEIDDREPRLPTAAEYDIDGAKYDAVVVERRDRWDNRILREHFDKTLSLTRGEKHISSNVIDSARTKRDFESSIEEITEHTTWASAWLRGYLEGKVVATEES